MGDDKGSDLDVFEGLTKKKAAPVGAKIPAAPGTLRGGLGGGMPSPSGVGPASAAPPSRGLPLPKPPPKKKPSKPSQPAVSAPAASAPVALPKPKPPPPKGSKGGSVPPPTKAPEVIAEPIAAHELVDEPSSSVLPGDAAPELDWDDDEEATAVFDRSEHELFDDIRVRPAAGDGRRRGVGTAAALLATSGRNAAAVKAAPPTAKAPQDSMPRIPAPAPVPRDMSSSASVQAQPPPEQQPSWKPQAIEPPPKQGASKSTIFLVLFAALAMVAAAVLYLRSSASSEVSFTVEDEQGKTLTGEAKVFVDGQKKCDFAPCKTELKPGKKVIRVVYPHAGSNMIGTMSIEVEGGAEATFTIPVKTSEDAPAPVVSASSSATAAPDEPASLKLTTGLKDVDLKVFIDGKQQGVLKAGTPLELKELEPGKHTVRVEGGEQFGAFEKVLELKPGESAELPDLKLPLLKVKTTFELATAGVVAKLMQEKDGKTTEQRLLFRGTRALATLDTSYSYTLKATANGYKDYEEKISFDDDSDTKTVKIELEKDDGPAPVAQVPGPAPGPNPKTSTGSGTPPQPPAGGHGIINANSIPPSKVIIDGRPRGSTPVTGVRVSAGSHLVIFRHKTRGTKSRTVMVGAGQTKTATVRFKAPE